MAEKEKAGVPKTLARSREISTKGILTSQDFMNFMSALISDLGEEIVRPQVGNAQCNAAGKLLKMAELQQKYGVEPTDKSAGKVLHLAKI